MNPDELLAQAREVAKRAYAPYSGFRVGAVVETDDGSRFSGVNVENSSYPEGWCAETSALAAAATAGYRTIRAVAVACIDAKDGTQTFPCGGCRQRLYEFGTDLVIVPGPEGGSEVYRLDDLLPHGFKLQS